MGSVAKLKFTEAKVEPKLLKLDLGSFQPMDGFTHVKKEELFTRVNVLNDPLKPSSLLRWRYKDNSVDEANCNYVLHLLSMEERVLFFNELYRVLKPGAKCRIDVPYWCSAKAYGDPRVQFPPVTEYFFPMLSKAYRDQQRDPTSIGLTCNFDHTLGYGMHPMIATRNQEYQQHAVSFWKEAAQELIVTVTKPE